MRHSDVIECIGNTRKVWPYERSNIRSHRPLFFTDNKSSNKMKKIVLLFLLIPLSAFSKDLTIAVTSQSPVTAYALRQFRQSVEKTGFVVKETTPAQASVVVSTEASLGKETYRIERRGNQLLLQTGDDKGTLYGLLDVGEQLRWGKSLAQIPAKTVRPRLSFRAVKFNLPYMAYRNGPSLTQHDWTCRDLNFWEAYLDNMAQNRFNVLSLWSQHLFHYMVMPEHFPEATQFNEFEMGEWKMFWKELFRMAHERGIETYLINWNTFVSPSFARAHNVGGYEGSHFGDGDTTKITERYTREIIRQVIDEYDDLDGLGITLGERMGGQSPEERRAWLDRTVLAGMRDAKRKIKFVYRAPLSANEKSGGTTSYENDRLTRQQVDTLDVTQSYVEFKYNWSHGHSSPNLFHVHGGKLSDAYWNPVSDKFKVVWTLRNEDFFVLRWGQPDFIRQFIGNNGADYVGGCFVGSEGLIPAKDYISQDGPHRTWNWHFQRQWLWYASWGRLLYDETTPDTVFQNLLADRFGADKAKDLLVGWKNASQVPLLFASYHKGQNDLSLYTESFGNWFGAGKHHLFDINSIIDHPVLDTLRFVNIKTYLANGDKVPPGILSPPQLADSLDRIAQRGLTITKKWKGKGTPTLDAELADLAAWSYFARYFADKLRAGVALAKYRQGGQVTDQNKAVSLLEKCVTHWKNYVTAIEQYNKPSFLFHTADPFSFARKLAEVEHDVDIARK